MINAVNEIVELSAVTLYDANAFLANRLFEHFFVLFVLFRQETAFCFAESQNNLIFVSVHQ